MVVQLHGVPSCTTVYHGARSIPKYCTLGQAHLPVTTTYHGAPWCTIIHYGTVLWGMATYHSAPLYTMVHHGAAPQYIPWCTMVRYHRAHSAPWCTMVYYRGVQWCTVVYHDNTVVHHVVVRDTFLVGMVPGCIRFGLLPVFDRQDWLGTLVTVFYDTAPKDFFMLCNKIFLITHNRILI